MLLSTEDEREAVTTGLCANSYTYSHRDVDTTPVFVATWPAGSTIRLCKHAIIVRAQADKVTSVTRPLRIVLPSPLPQLYGPSTYLYGPDKARMSHAAHSLCVIRPPSGEDLDKPGLFAAPRCSSRNVPPGQQTTNSI